MLPKFSEYCELLTALPEQYQCIVSSTLRAFTIGPFAAEIEGQIIFADGFVLDVWELLDLSTRSIRRYNYALDKQGERVWWYDPQEHPNNPVLASTHPHHKHIHPDIKHNRIPAPGLSFIEPNLPFLIREIEQLLQESTA